MGAMDLVEGFKEVAKQIKAYKDLPLYNKIVELSKQVQDLSDENLQLKQELALKAKTKFQAPYWFEEGSDVPLCPKCYDLSGGQTRSHLTHPSEDFVGGHGRRCRVCQEFFKEGPRLTPLSQPPMRNYWE